MITITKYELRYDDALKRMMLMENLDYAEIELCRDSLYLVLEGDEVLGFGYYNIYDDEIYIDHLFIKPAERLNKLGDSLFRAILNSIHLMGVKMTYMRENALYDDFLASEDLYLSEGRYVIDLDAFFSRKCNSERQKPTPLN